MISEAITGIILAGGRSSRMGQNKALLKYKGKPLIEIVYENISAVCDSVVLISNDSNDYKFLKCPVYKDLIPGYGPLSGIHSGLYNSNTPKSLILSCDLPFITTNVLSFLIKSVENEKVTLFKEGEYLQPLCSVIDRSILTEIEQIIAISQPSGSSIQKTRQYSIKSLLQKTTVKIIDINSTSFKSNSQLFQNINTPEDYEKLKSADL